MLDVPEVICDVPHLLSLSDKITHCRLGIKQTVMRRVDDLISVNPNRVRNQIRYTFNHSKQLHDAENSFDVADNGYLVSRAQITRFCGDGGFGMEDGGVSHVLRISNVFCAGFIDYDVFYSKGEHHFFADLIRFLIPAGHPVAVGNKSFIAIPAVKVYQEIALLDDLLCQYISNPLAECPFRIPWEDTVQVLPIIGIVIDDPLLESRDVRDVDHYYCAG